MACDQHIEYILAASDGRGCDRHLMGLSLLLEQGEEAKLFKDPVYTKSRHFRLSTSNLFPGKFLAGTGFGSVAHDGYGMNYMIDKGEMKIGVESKKSCDVTSSEVFTRVLEGVWRDMKRVVEEGLLSDKPKL